MTHILAKLLPYYIKRNISLNRRTSKMNPPKSANSKPFVPEMADARVHQILNEIPDKSCFQSKRDVSRDVTSPVAISTCHAVPRLAKREDNKKTSRNVNIQQSLRFNAIAYSEAPTHQ